MNGDIELEIGAGSGTGNYVVRVVRAAAGGEPVGTLELDVEEMLSRRGLLEATVLASAVAHRSVSAAEQPVRDVGRQLFNALFNGPVYGMYRASLGVAQQRGKRLRVVLRLTAPELAALPWETLFDPETETYLCRQEPLVRHVPAPYTSDPLEVSPPLRILGLIASPRGLPELDVDAEKGHLAEALAEPIAEGLIEVVWVARASWEGVHSRLLAGEWHVLHFVGHGDYDTRTDEGVLALVGADGRADMVEATRLADLLGEAQPAPRLIMLNSCSSGQSGAQDLFSGTAAALVRSGISAVAAMQFTVSDTAAIAFARGFYTAIAHGRNVDEAARSGRISILGAPRSLEWVTPVLYVRGQATQLFTFTAPPGPGAETLPEPRAALWRPAPAAQPIGSARRRLAELRALYVEARAELRVEHFGTAVALFDDLLTLDPDYYDAAELRAAAERGRRLADTYTSAVTADIEGDWAAAVRGYSEILQDSPGYRDVAVRKEACEARQQVADLQAELLVHSNAGEWQAVLEVDAELAGLDPSLADTDGLATRARASLAASQKAADLERRYAQARAAEDNGDWTAGIEGYNDILAADPEYRDVAARREVCRKADQVASLQTELGEQAEAGAWPQVLTTIARLADLDPAAAARLPITEFAVRARLEIATYPAGPLRRIDCLQPVCTLSWHPDGLRIAVADGARVTAYNVPDNKKMTGDGAIITAGGRKSSVLDAAFSPQGTYLATASDSKQARVSEIARGKMLLEVRHDAAVQAVTFSPDGTRLATGSTDKNARIWHLARQQVQAHSVFSPAPPLKKGPLLEVRHDGAVDAVAFSPDGSQLATASTDKTARIWDAASGQKLLEVRHDAAVHAVAFSPDGSQLATASTDKTARIWDAASGQKLLEVRHDAAVHAVAFSPDGSQLATASTDKTARIWDAASGQKLLEVRHDAAVHAVAFSPDGSQLATGSADKTARIWRVAEREP